MELVGKAFCGSYQSEYAHNNTAYNNVKELLSRSYLAPVCSYLGAVLEIKDRMMDNGGVDATIELPSGEGRPVPLRIDLQLKATSCPELDPDGEHLVFDLKRETFDGMSSEKRTSPWLLFVLILPEDVHTWVSVTEDELSEHAYMVWCDAKDCRIGDGEKSVRLKIPLSNRVTIESLHGMLLDQLEDEQ